MINSSAVSASYLESKKYAHSPERHSYRSHHPDIATYVGRKADTDTHIHTYVKCNSETLVRKKNLT